MKHLEIKGHDIGYSHLTLSGVSSDLTSRDISVKEASERCNHDLLYICRVTSYGDP